MTDLGEFVDSQGTLVDVRSPLEFAHSSIPGAVNIPLLTDDERAQVGICYKEQGQKSAIRLGFKLAGPNFHRFIEKADSLPAPLKIFCWRGGMRSDAMCWVLSFSRLPTLKLDGGYKAFRRWALSRFEMPYHVHILGGLTGSGKTSRLHEMEREGKQILDLEALASHKGSSFGGIGMPAQPSTEMFENKIALSLRHIDPEKPLWIEDESRNIGKCKIPDALFNQMKGGEYHLLECSKEERLDRLVADYGSCPKEELTEAAIRLEKKLGSERTKKIAALIDADQMRDAFDLLLNYYDSTYQHALKRKMASLQIKETPSFLFP